MDLYRENAGYFVCLSVSGRRNRTHNGKEGGQGSTVLRFESDGTAGRVLTAADQRLIDAWRMMGLGTYGGGERLIPWP